MAIREDQEEEAGDERTSGRERDHESGGEDAIKRQNNIRFPTHPPTKEPNKGGMHVEARRLPTALEVVGEVYAAIVWIEVAAAGPLQCPSGSRRLTLANA